MPDLDILGKNVSYQFAPAYRLIRGRASDAEVLTALRRGTTQTLVRGNGLPGLRARAALVVAAGESGSGGTGAAIRASRELIIGEQGSRHSHIVHRALSRMLADGVQPTSQVEAEHLLGRYAMHELLEHRLFSCLGFEAREFGMTPDEFSAYTRRLHDSLEPDIRVLAQQLVDDPSGASIRTPPSPSRARLTTREILEQEV